MQIFPFCLLLAWSKMEYVIYLAQCLGLSQRPSSLREQAAFLFLIPLIKMVLSSNYASINASIECYNMKFYIEMEC